MSARIKQDLVAVALLIVLALAVFYRLLLQPTAGFYSEICDLPALNASLKTVLVRSFQETGEIPLWNPYICSGMFLAHDSQTAAFYPLHVVLYLLPPEEMDAILSWLTVVHVMIAGVTMYAYARWHRLEALPAFVAGAGYMLAGKWLLHLCTAGHYPMVGLAWVPLVLLCLDKAIRGASVWWSCLGGVVFAILILGSHPQVIFYSGLLAAMWSLGTALETAGWFGQPKRRSVSKALFAWLGLGTVTVGIAALLAAVQLIPNVEVIPYGSRSLGMAATESLRLTFWKILMLVGPPMGDPFWENQGGIGVLWFASAIMALVVGTRRAWFQWSVCLLVIFYGVGGSALLQELPGFSFFRCPGRMLWFAAIPISLLTGETVQALFMGSPVPSRSLAVCRVILLVVTISGLAAMPLVGAMLRVVGQATVPLQQYWPAGLLSVGIAMYLVLYFLGSRGALGGYAYTAVLVADLWLLIHPFLMVREYDEVLQKSACLQWVKERTRDGHRVLDRDLLKYTGSGPVGLTLPMVYGVEAVRGWHSLDVLRYKEYVAFIADRDIPTWQKDVIVNTPIVNKHLLDALAVKYVVQPSDREFAVVGEKPLAGDERWQKVYEDANPIGSYNVMSFPRITKLPPYAVYENREVLPRAWIVGRAIPEPERARVRTTLKGMDLRSCVMIAGLDQPEEYALTQTHCEAVLRQANRLVYRTRSDGPGFLVFSEVWFPGWRCWIDGEEVPVLRANYALRAVRLPAGEHEVKMVMAPASFWWGKVISLATLAVLLGWAGAWVVYVWRKRAGKQVHGHGEQATLR
jgi:hypothetical protein